MASKKPAAGRHRAVVRAARSSAPRLRSRSRGLSAQRLADPLVADRVRACRAAGPTARRGTPRASSAPGAAARPAGGPRAAPRPGAARPSCRSAIWSISWPVARPTCRRRAARGGAAMRREVARVAAQLVGAGLRRRSRGAPAAPSCARMSVSAGSSRHLGAAAERLLGLRARPSSTRDHVGRAPARSARLLVAARPRAQRVVRRLVARPAGARRRRPGRPRPRQSSSSSATEGYGEPASPSFWALSSESEHRLDRRRAWSAAAGGVRRAGAGPPASSAEPKTCEPDRRALVDQRRDSRAPRGRRASG